MKQMPVASDRVYVPKRSEVSYIAAHMSFDIWTQAPFALKSLLSPQMYVNKKGVSAAVGTDEQLEQWHECVEAANKPYESFSGWTACFAGTAPIGYAEACAASLAARAMRAGATVAWVDVSRALRERIYTAAEATHNRSSSPFLTVVTGIRGVDGGGRADRAFDILRSCPPGSNRIVIGASATPMAIMLGLGLGVQRILNLGEGATNEAVRR